VQARIETEDYAMSLVRNRRGVLSALFSALLALAVFDPGAATAQEAKQIKLTEKHIQGAMAAYKDMAKLYEGASSDKSDPRVEAQAAAIAKMNGFASLDEYDDAWTCDLPIRTGSTRIEVNLITASIRTPHTASTPRSASMMASCPTWQSDPSPL
jgi:hypothetical protein